MKKAWNRVELDENELKHMYLVERLSAREIANRLEIGIGIIYTRLREMKITRSGSEAAMGHRPANYRGWYIEKRTGYKTVVISKDNPFIDMAIRTQSGGFYMREHRLVMAQYLGRNLKPWEVIHHKNHDKLDNRIENLELIAGQPWHNGETIAHNELNKMETRIIKLEIENKQLQYELEKCRAALLAKMEKDD